MGSAPSAPNGPNSELNVPSVHVVQVGKKAQGLQSVDEDEMICATHLETHDELVAMNKDEVVAIHNDEVVTINNPAKKRQPRESIECSTPRECIQLLMTGNARFVNGVSIHPHQDANRRAKIAPHQRPHSTILGCSDSRVPTELLFDQGFGDLFICRVAGNVASTEEIASCEYSVLELGVKVILILGHSSCGAVKAAIKGGSYPGFIDALLDHISCPIERASRDRPQDEAMFLKSVVIANVQYQMERVLRSQPVIDAVEKKTLIVAGGYYDLETGKIEFVPLK